MAVRIRWPLIFILLVGLYSISAHWTTSEQNVDTIAATLPAWHLVTEGSFDLSEYSDLNPWIVETPTGFWSNRPPGLILAATIGHAAALPFGDGYSGVPGTALAVLFAAAAVTLVAIEIGRLHGSRAASLSAVALGIASATWHQSSTELFPHAVGQFLMALVIRFLARERLWLAGAVLGLAITVRPPIAVIALVIGLGVGWTTRSVRPVVQIGVPATLGLAMVVVYNRLVFGRASISGGYSSFLDDGSGYRTVSGYLSNLFGTFFDGSNGLLVWSSWIAVVVLYLLVRRPAIDRPWIAVAAVAGLSYVVVHAALNRFSGGLAFNYRYPLEALVLVMPLLGLGLATILQRRTWRMATLTAFGVSIALQAAAAFLLTCVDESGVAVCSLL